MKTMASSLAALLLLASCAGVFWKESGWPGPLVEGNRRPSIVYSCDEVSLAIADSKYCVHALVDHAGRRLRIDEDVVEVVEAYLPNIPSLAGWAGPQRSTLRWSPQFSKTGFPYRVHILTVSPIVVMVVPIGQSTRERICIGSLGEGCLRSKALERPLFFLAAPEVQPGSFWFSPELKIPETRIPDDERQFVIPLGASRLELSANGSTWDVRRNLR